MRGNQFYIDGRLYRFDYSGSSPPWPMQVWDDPTQDWQDIGIYGAVGPAGPAQPSSALVISTRSVLADDWLALPSGEAVVDASGAGIVCGLVSAVPLPEFVLTAQGDTIAVGGM